MSTRFGVPILAVLLTVGSANLASAAYCGAANYRHCAWNGGAVVRTASQTAADDRPATCPLYQYGQSRDY